MKKLFLPLALCLCLLLTACGGRAERARFQQFSRELADREGLSFTADVRAEYPDRSVSFTLAYRADADGETMTVLDPELIRGISARLAPGSTTLEYEGMILDLGSLDDFGLSPVSALPALVDALKNGHLDSQWEENGELAFDLIRDDALSATVWFEPESMTPRRAELRSEGRAILFCQIKDWS